MDALSTSPNSGIPMQLTNFIDPEIIRIAFAPMQAAKIISESKRGTWLDETAMFPVVEETGEVSAYGDFNSNGRAGVNTNWPSRQSFHFQVMKEYGEREVERAGLSRLNWVSEIDKSATGVLNRGSNYTYFFGVQGLQNYGLLNEPNLLAALTPSPKVLGGTAWVTSGVVTATANEIYQDLQSMYYQLTYQTAGLADAKTAVTIAMAPQLEIAMSAKNAYGVGVKELLKDFFDNITFETAVQYGAYDGTNNPQGVRAGNMVQMIANEIDGTKVAFCAFTEKLRSHRLVPDTSSWKQKMTSGTWGTILRKPVGIVTMVGV